MIAKHDSDLMTKFQNPVQLGRDGIPSMADMIVLVWLKLVMLEQAVGRLEAGK